MDGLSLDGDRCIRVIPRQIETMLTWKNISRFKYKRVTRRILKILKRSHIVRFSYCNSSNLICNNQSHFVLVLIVRLCSLFLRNGYVFFRNSKTTQITLNVVLLDFVESDEYCSESLIFEEFGYKKFCGDNYGWNSKTNHTIRETLNFKYQKGFTGKGGIFWIQLTGKICLPFVFRLNRVFRKWSRNSVNSTNSGNLINN